MGICHCDRWLGTLTLSAPNSGLNRSFGLELRFRSFLDGSNGRLPAHGFRIC
ncbi:hypothetical protein RISK_002403 [Rhodopirellula islandica]|uniref:Uncharacterized protein n=1 Tax=Rhodopirellula islandica TaxID=595434 RepID=A0A0J1BGX0_RHOIS|nr:hypothetical protein RISK_002403 [Rhodopirellula islandica]